LGARGPHYCLGHVLGREVIKAEMREIYHRMENLEVGESDLLLSNFMKKVKRLPGKWTPERKRPS
jgi:cytochrome P450